MSYTVFGSFQATSKFTQQSSLPLVTYSGAPTLAYSKSYATTDVTKLFFNTYTITTTPTVIDVTSLTDAFGQAISFTSVKLVHIVNTDTTNNLTAGGGSNPLFSALPTLVGQAGTPDTGSCVTLTTNLTVSGSAKNISLTASAGSISVEVYLVGN